MDIHRDSTSTTTRKCPLITDDVDDTEKKKHRKKGQKFIELSGVPPKLPILRNRKSGSKYQGVYFDKLYNKWRARIKIDGKKHHIGTFVLKKKLV